MLCPRRLYFDKALPLILLYRQEREQYERLRAATSKGKEFVPSDIYGAEHLLRLFVRLPHLLAQTAMGAQEVSQVRHIDSRCCFVRRGIHCLLCGHRDCRKRAG